MISKDAILASFAFGDRIVDRYLADLSDADLLIRPVAGQNHIAWQLGHLIASERWMVERVRPGSSPELPSGFTEAHAKDETAPKSDESGRFLSKERYLALMKAQREATKAVLADLSEADLNAPAPEGVPAWATTVSGLLLLAANHVLMHVGQFVSVRRTLQKPVAI
jgi:hypothetical protein